MSTSAIFASRRFQSHKRQLFIRSIAALMFGIGPFLIWPALLGRILSTGFLPHSYCYLRQSALVWTHVAADSSIGLAYVAISGTLAYLVYRARRDIPFHWMFLAFGVFIVACGGTHFVEVVTVWIPVYIFSAAVKVFTAIVSLATAAALPLTVPRVLELIQRAKRSHEVMTKLRESETRIRAITQTAPDAIISANSAGNIRYFNPAAERLFGYSAAELTDLMPARFRAEHLAGIKKFLSTKVPHVIGRSVELRARRKNHTEISIEYLFIGLGNRRRNVFYGNSARPYRTKICRTGIRSSIGISGRCDGNCRSHSGDGAGEFAD